LSRPSSQAPTRSGGLVVVVVGPAVVVVVGPTVVLVEVEVVLVDVLVLVIVVVLVEVVVVVDELVVVVVDVVVGAGSSPGCQLGSVSIAGTADPTRRVGVPPPALTTNRSGPFGAPNCWLLEENTMLLPSGDHAGRTPSTATRC
jgi:hypothetical protein